MSEYQGTTLNELLFVAGLLDAFDKAVRDGDRASMIEMLIRVEIGPREAETTTSTILTHPTK